MDKQISSSATAQQIYCIPASVRPGYRIPKLSNHLAKTMTSEHNQMTPEQSTCSYRKQYMKNFMAKTMERL